jgi:nitroimidazol reductase NimA-like FMN-containing flavoprotein (pyridoxamine 5'-phosphate oxidase superfamily)
MKIEIMNDGVMGCTLMVDGETVLECMTRENLMGLTLEEIAHLVEETKEVEEHMDGYKIVVHFGTPQRRETEKGAMALADRLQKQRKHGEVQKVWCSESGVRFETVRTF